ncbi:D-serine deaminase-like pyridoxal phosphate-dependent protein [Williamsia limnetica]|uniref:D-serine deaminase-like pyridoxal phosphate-dependent protein n=1 Tax=Williamsia limnetica TaxID=882452 RepID=A0A318RRB0_WILLI|nr:D-serine deaminase-like pyridoxal phosphate-dependent protein [Williamsia limnetica]
MVAPSENPPSGSDIGRIDRVLAATAGLDTPVAVVDEAVVEANLDRMAEFASSSGFVLRPHAKTHKSPELAARQISRGATGLTVATVGEAEVFAAAGVSDLFIAYPLWLTENKARRLRAIMDHAEVLLAVDSIAGAARIARHVPGARVVVEVDSGQHRTGVHPQRAGDIGHGAAAAGLEVLGIFTFPGHSYFPGRPVAVAVQEANALAMAAQSLRAVDIDPVIRSGGSTPSVAHADPTVLTEIRPGVYPFNDAQQVELGVCSMSDVALTVVTTVVHLDGNKAVLDAGSKSLGADHPAWTTGVGRLPDYGDARVSALSEHHATVDFTDSADRPELGDRVRLAPNHVCTAVNLADELVIVNRHGTLSRWPVTARGANA